jgi:hypothetical protein
MTLPLPPPRLPPPSVRLPALADAPVSSSTSPTPILIPRPVATALSSPASAAATATATASPLPSPGGRTKAQRWSDEGSHSSAVALVRGASRRSYKEVLLAADFPASGGAAGVVVGDGWIRVEGRRARRATAGTSKPLPRPVPVDLRGKCFNCFSSSHRAAACRSLVRCFSCRQPGHRALSCPSRRSPLSPSRPARVWRSVSRGAASLSGRAQVWRPVSRESSSVATPPGAMEAVLSSGLKKRTRRGQRRRKVAGVVSGQVASDHSPGGPARIVKFLRRSREPYLISQPSS